MTTALTPEFQTLEALKKESSLHCEVVRQVQELSEKHVREYDSLKQEHHERLVKVIEALIVSRYWVNACNLKSWPV
jgi:hypothetical protein